MNHYPMQRAAQSEDVGDEPGSPASNHRAPVSPRLHAGRHRFQGACGFSFNTSTGPTNGAM